MRALLFVGFLALVACNTPPGTSSQLNCGGSCEGLETPGCTKCGSACTAQSQCVATTIDGDWPLPICTFSKCRSVSDKVDIRLIYEVGDFSTSGRPPRTFVTRFISKKSVNGTAVTCSDIVNKTSATTPDAIEKSGAFNILALDVFEFGSTTITPGFAVFSGPVNAASSNDYVILAEAWSEPRKSQAPHYPQGTRLAVQCFDQAKQTPEISSKVDCQTSVTPPIESASCLKIALKLSPQN